MARVEFIRLTLTERCPTPSNMSWGRPSNKKLAGSVVSYVPQFYWGTGHPWHEANLWFFRQAELVQLELRDIKSLYAIATSIKAYMVFLELHDLNWDSFPDKYSDRCLVRYRGYLVSLRRDGELAPSTCSRRMGDILRFYDWLLSESLVGRKVLPFRKTALELPVFNPVGVKRTLVVYKRELSIPNRKSKSSELEYGLEPLTQKQKENILLSAKRYGSEELYLMLLISFSSGMRLGSICDLKLKTIYNAHPSYESEEIFHLNIGPAVREAPVATKFDISGKVIIPIDVLKEIKRYCESHRRYLRAAKSHYSDKDIVFLNRNGMPYVRKGKDQSSSLNVEIFRLRKTAAENGIDFSSFKFHSARATFASEVAALGLRTFGLKNISAVIGLVKNLLMHKDEKTSLAYISFLRQREVLDSFQNIELSKIDLGEDTL